MTKSTTTPASLPLGVKIARTWWLSITDVAFYRFAHHLSRRFVWTYILVSYAILATMSTIFFAVATLPQLKTQTFTFADKIVAQLPDNFSAQYQDGRLVASPSSLLLRNPDETSATPSAYFLTLDTTVTVPASPAAFIHLGNTQLILDASGSPRTLSYRDVIGNDQLHWQTNDWPAMRAAWQKNWQAAVPWFTIGFWLTSWVGVLLLRLLLLILYVWLGQSWLRWNWRPAPNFAESYRVGLLLLVVAEAIARLLHILYPTNVWIGVWIVWLILWLCVGYFTRRIGRTE